MYDFAAVQVINQMQKLTRDKHNDVFVNVSIAYFLEFVTNVNECANFREFRDEDGGIVRDETVFDVHVARQLKKFALIITRKNF